MATSQQSTFGDVSVNLNKSNHTCDGSTGLGPNGEPKRCGNTAHYVVLRHVTGMAEFYCKTHAKDTWEEMVEE